MNSWAVLALALHYPIPFPMSHDTQRSFLRSDPGPRFRAEIRNQMALHLV